MSRLFEKGKSGNPKGRPKGIKTPRSASLRALKFKVEELTPDLVEAIAEIATNATEKTSDRLRAASYLIEFAYGKPGPRNDDEGLPEGFMRWPIDERRAWAQDQIRKAQQLDDHLASVQERDAG